MSEIVLMTPQRTATSYDILMTDEGDVQITHQKWSGDKKGSLIVTQILAGYFVRKKQGEPATAASQSGKDSKSVVKQETIFLFFFFILISKNILVLPTLEKHFLNPKNQF